MEEKSSKDGDERFASTSDNGDVAVDVDNQSEISESQHDQTRIGQHTISNFETIVHIIKGNIGMGILTLPRALRNSGLAGGVIGLMFIACVCVYCMNMLVKAAHKALRSRPNIRFIDYAETAEAAFRDAGGRWDRCASGVKKLLNIFLCANQISSNAVYILFIAQNIQPISVHYGGSAMEMNYRFYILMVLPFMLLLCSVRNLRYLSPFSIVANVIQMVGLGIIFYYIFNTELKSSTSLPLFAAPSRLPLFFGTAIFAIEGISVVLPIENQMRHPRDMLRLNGVLNTSMALVVVLYIAMGFYGYLKYGEDVQASITLNLPLGEIAAQVTLCLFSVAVFFSYALQFYVVIDVINRTVLVEWFSGCWLDIADYSTRIVINLFTFALAATVPWLDLFVSLLGAVKMSTLSLMAPAIIDTASNWNELGVYNWKMVKNISIFIFGLFGCIIGTIVTLHNIVEKFMTGDVTFTKYLNQH